jgi:hypothetical protein
LLATSDAIRAPHKRSERIFNHLTFNHPFLFRDSTRSRQATNVASVLLNVKKCFDSES